MKRFKVCPTKLIPNTFIANNHDGREYAKKIAYKMIEGGNDPQKKWRDVIRFIRNNRANYQ